MSLSHWSFSVPYFPHRRDMQCIFKMCYSAEKTVSYFCGISPLHRKRPSTSILSKWNVSFIPYKALLHPLIVISDDKKKKKYFQIKEVSYHLPEYKLEKRCLHETSDLLYLICHLFRDQPSFSITEVTDEDLFHCL